MDFDDSREPEKVELVTGLEAKIQEIAKLNDMSPEEVITSLFQMAFPMAQPVDAASKELNDEDLPDDLKGRDFIVI